MKSVIEAQQKRLKKYQKRRERKYHPYNYRHFFHVKELDQFSQDGNKGSLLCAQPWQGFPRKDDPRAPSETAIIQEKKNFSLVNTITGELLVSKRISQQTSRNLSHDITHQVTFEIERSGLTLRRRNLSNARPVRGGGKRSAINAFSDASRRNLRRMTENHFPELVSQFGLTYHKQFPAGHQVKAHLNTFLTWLRRKVPGVAYLWILEFQSRGVPHFHLFLDIMPGPNLHAEMAQRWVEITSGTSEQLKFHKHARNWIKWDMGSGGYLCKYLDKEAQKKVPEGFGWVGRFWAASRGLRPSPLQVQETDLYEISGEEDVLARVIRALGQIQERRRKRWGCPHPSLRKTQKSAYIPRVADTFWRLLDYYTKQHLQSSPIPLSASG